MTGPHGDSTWLPPTGRPRIVHLIKGLSVVGGAERLVYSLTTAGDRERFDYRVAHVLTDPSEHLLKQLESASVPVYSLRASTHYDLRWSLRFRKLIIRDRIDLVHLHLPYTAGFGRLIMRSIPRSRRPQIVHTQHTPWDHTALATRVLNRATFRMDNADFAVSERTWSSLPRRFRTRTEVLVHGIPLSEMPDPALARTEVRSEFGITTGDVLVVTVANMRKEKAYEVLLRAARVLVDEGLPVQFIAVGYGPLEEEVRRLRDDLGLHERFILTGFRSDALRVVAGADLFALASYYEAFPIAVMEALAVGVPVVSTSVGDLAHVVGATGAGLIVRPGDTQALANALRTLVVERPLRERMAECARAVGQTFDIQRAASRLEDVYTDLLSQPRLTKPSSSAQQVGDGGAS